MRKATAKQGTTAAVRRYVREHYAQPAKRSGHKRFQVTVGEVHRALGLHNRVPLVCNALASRKFLEENGLRIVERKGPPSGQSTTVALTYELIEQQQRAKYAALRELRGIGRETFAALGGGEKFLRREREALEKAMEERERNW